VAASAIPASNKEQGEKEILKTRNPSEREKKTRPGMAARGEATAKAPTPARPARRAF
jgi:hypothetical protein